MRQGVPLWITGALIAAVAAPLARTNEAQAQGFEVPLSVSHFVYRPGEDAERLEHLRAWSFGLGLILGPKNRAGYALVAHAAYGGPYWYVAGSAGVSNSGSPVIDDFGFGVNAHYNVFQSRDFRTRVGWQAGWSTSSSSNSRSHAIDYRAVVSHALSTSLSLYGGLGAETSRFRTGGSSTGSTNPSLLAGAYTRLGQGFAFSTGVESVFSDPSRVRLSGSVQFETDHDDDPDVRSP